MTILSATAPAYRGQRNERAFAGYADSSCRQRHHRLKADGPEADGARVLRVRGRQQSDPAVGAGPPAGPRAPGLAVHVACYAVVLAVALAVIPPAASFGADDGAYGGQVFALTRGDWALERPLAVVDQANEGWFNSAITPDGPTPYTANPGYALLLLGAVELTGGAPAAGTAGGLALALQLVPVIGALLSAVVAWALAARWSRSAAPLAFWLLGLGPVLVNSTTLWAHTLSTALGGAALLAVVDLADRSTAPSGARRLPLTLGLVASLAAAAALRTEAVLWIPAVCGVAVLVDRSIAMVATSSLGGIAGGAAWIANRSWGQSLRADRLPVETSIDTLRASPDWLASRLPAAWQLLMTSLDGGLGQILVLVAIVLTGLAILWLRAGGATGAAGPVAITATAAAYLACSALAPGEVITGTVAAWPLAVVLLLAGRRPVPRPQPGGGPGRPGAAIVLLVPAGLLVVLVALTQYSGSGGLQWGGRYLSMGFAPLAAAAAIRGEALFRACRGPMLALLMTPALAGLVVSHQLHTRHRSVVEAVTAEPSEVVITEIPALPRIAWTALPTAVYLADPTTVDALLADLAAAGVTSVNVQGLHATDLEGTAGFRVVSATGEVRHLERHPLPPALVAPGP
jgi:hypothetical protein